MRCIKVKFSTTEAGTPRTLVKYERDTGGDPDVVQMESCAPRHIDFDAAMASLLPHCMELMQLPESYTERLSVMGVSFSNKEGVMGAVVTLMVTLPAGVTSINTPHLPEVPYDPDQAGPSMPANMVHAVWDVEKEAIAYATGEKRHDLFSGSQTENPVKEIEKLTDSLLAHEGCMQVTVEHKDGVVDLFGGQGTDET